MKIAVLGCGNMASAIVLGIHEKLKDVDFFTYTPSFIKADKLAKQVSGTSVRNLAELPECDAYLIGCKPQQFEALATSLNELHKVSDESLVVSILAGTTIKRIVTALKVKKVLRVMPNTPTLIGMGVNALCFSENISSSEQRTWEQLFETSSRVFTFNEEKLIDTITPFSGSGPAYIFEFARIFSKKLEKMGLNHEKANEMIAHTFLGASNLLVQSKESPEQLRKNVTSKKGVTYEALEVFSKHGIEQIFDEAIDAAYKRNEELSKL